jgi:hypothetical protein
LGNILKKHLYFLRKPQEPDRKRKVKDKAYHCLQFVGLIGSIKAASPLEEGMETINPSRSIST